MLTPRLLMLSIMLPATLSMPAPAQTLTAHRPFGPGLTLEAAFPQFESRPGQQTSVTILTATAGLRAGDRSAIHISLPYLRYHYRTSYTGPYASYGSEGGDEGIMNLGVVILTRPGDNSAWEFRVTVPMVSEENAPLGPVGLISDFDRFESYLRKILTTGIYGNLYSDDSSMFVGRLRIGPTAWIPTEGGGNEVEAALDAGVGVGVRLGPFEGGAFLSTRSILTEEAWFSDRTILHSTLSFQVTFSRFRLQAFYRIPHNDALNRNVDGTVGIVGTLAW